jgi:hypothetical protein
MDTTALYARKEQLIQSIINVQIMNKSLQKWNLFQLKRSNILQ